MEKVNWEKIQEFYDKEHTWRDLQKEFNLNMQILALAFKNNLLRRRSKEECSQLRALKPSKKHSLETKQKISTIRKKFLQDNPEKHPWRKPNKHISAPCNKAKEFLKLLGVNFIEEFSPEIEGRFFSIDIAIPDKMIAIEVNGGQHYSKDGSLKPYFQERHDLIEKAGWKVFEIHCTACFKLEKWEEFAEIIESSSAVKDFDYFNYQPKNKKISICGVCQKNKKTLKSLSCNDCHRKKGKVAIKPTKEELENLIKEMPMTKIGEKYGVSDNAVKKWCKKYNIVLENRRGYWTKIKKTKLI
jgi:hypothetical protein